MSNIGETPPTQRQLVLQMAQQVRAMMQQIQGFGFVSTAERKRIATAANLPDKFFLGVGLACDALPLLSEMSLLTGAECRDVVELSDALLTLAAEMEVAFRGLRDTVASKRFGVGNRALRAYNVAKTMDRPADREVLMPYLRMMKEALPFGRPRKKPENEQPAAGQPPAEGGTTQPVVQGAEPRGNAARR